MTGHALPSQSRILVVAGIALLVAGLAATLLGVAIAARLERLPAETVYPTPEEGALAMAEKWYPSAENLGISLSGGTGRLWFVAVRAGRAEDAPSAGVDHPLPSMRDGPLRGPQVERGSVGWTWDCRGYGGMVVA